MPPPRVLGPSQRVPGAIDIETDEFGVLPMDPSHPEVAALLGSSPVGTGPHPDAPPESPVGTGPHWQPSSPGGQGASAPIANNPTLAAPGTATDAPTPTAQVLADAYGVRSGDPSIAGAVSQQLAQRAPAAPVRGAFREGPATPTAPAQPTTGGPVRAIVSRSGGASPRMRSLADQAQQTFTTEQGAVRDQAEARASGNDRMAEFQTGLGVDLAVQQEEQRQRHVERQAALAQEMGKLERMSAEVAARDLKPREVFVDQDAGQAVTSAIAVALGAMGQYLTGGPNAALEMIHEAIDRDLAVQRENAASDLEAQRAGIESAERGVTRQQGILDRTREAFADEDQWEAAQRVMKIEAAQRQAQALAMESENEEARANAEQVVAGLERQRLSALMQFERAAQARASVQYQVPGMPMPLTQSQAFTLLREREGREAEAQGDGLTPETRVRALEHYGKSREAIEQARDSISRLAPSYAPGENVPGTGYIEGNLPSILAGQEGRDVRADQAVLVQRLIQALTGATATPEQEATARRYYGLDGSDEDARRGLLRAQQDLVRRERDLAAATPPPIVEQWEARRRGARGPSSFRSE